MSGGSLRLCKRVSCRVKKCTKGDGLCHHDVALLDIGRIGHREYAMVGGRRAVFMHRASPFFAFPRLLRFMEGRSSFRVIHVLQSMLASRLGYLLQDLAACFKTWLLASRLGYLLQDLATCFKTWLLASRLGCLLQDLAACCKTWLLALRLGCLL
eukprot:scaffold3_cov273-Pinguiococcus_pyrenoidosus.AAC.22